MRLGFYIFWTVAYFVVIFEECIYAVFDMTRKIQYIDTVIEL